MSKSWWMGAALATAALSASVTASAHAATVAVDDDRAQCPAAAHTSVQAAIDAAAPGDTVAICPGEYAEGSGEAASNGLTIAKSLTLRGAGADLVRIFPAGTGSDPSILEPSPDIRNGVGDVVAVVGTPAVPVTVHLSGITVSGEGVVSEAGIVFLDAGGSITRSRVTNIVTSEAADAYSEPGGYRSSVAGYGIAQVTAAADTTGLAQRTLTVSGTRIDRYNAAGVIADGAPNALALASDQIVGRVLCQNYLADGNCAVVTIPNTGPLFGQDGVRAAGGATAEVRNTLVSQNLVAGTGAPVRSTNTTPNAAGNENLRLGAGVRLLGAGPGSKVTSSNVTDNAYGVMNLLADGTSANPAAVDATNNWWGLRYNSATNPGPAVSPLTNPPFPENPVNGVLINDPLTPSGQTSSAVDFFPYRNGPQGDPTTGQHAILDVPQPALDGAPSVTASAAIEGEQATISALAEDDFGVASVTFFSGATSLGQDTAPPYQATLELPDCAPRTVTAVARDSAGQTASDSIEFARTGCVDPTPTPTPTPTPSPTATAQPTPGPSATPTATPGPGSDPPKPIDLSGIPGTIPSAGLNLPLLAPPGFTRIDVFLGADQVCLIPGGEPATCRLEPTGAQVGRQVLRVVLNVGGVALESSRPITVSRFRARLGLTVRSTRSGRRTLAARLLLPERVTRGQGCRSGSMTFRISRGGVSLGDRQVRLSRSCTATRRVTLRGTGRAYTVNVRFGGNTVLSSASRTRRFK